MGEEFLWNMWKVYSFFVWTVLPHHVSLKQSWPCAGVVALLAGKRHLAGVWKHVTLHAIGAIARITALITCKGPCSSVCENVCLEMLSLSGRIVALITHERLPTWVGSNMYLEVTCRRAGKITLVATKRLLSWMSAHVFLDGISLCAWIVTLVAGQRKICIGINLWKVSANTELCTMRFTLQTKTKKGGERNPQRPYVCLLVHSNFSSKHSHSVSYRSKTIQLPVVWFLLNQINHSSTFFTHSFGEAKFNILYLMKPITFC